MKTVVAAVEWFAQNLATVVYLAVILVLAIPFIAFSATMHAAVDLWAVCEDELRTSKSI